MGTGKERKDSGHMTTRPFNFRIPLMKFQCSSQATNMPGFLITAVVTIKNALMFWLWEACKLFREESNIMNEIQK
jgi:hypothetical protein